MKRALFIVSLVLAASAAAASETYVPPPESRTAERVTVMSVYQERCAKCHALSRPDSATKDYREWQKTVEAMRARDPKWFTAEEGSRIAEFLAGRTLFRIKCVKCHAADRSDVQKTAPQWESTVERMQKKNPSWISDADRELILFYLTDVNLLVLE